MAGSNQKEKNDKLISGVFIYAIGTFGTKLLSFLIVPLYTYYISTSDMGVYDLLYTTISMLTPLVTLQISDAAYRWIIRKEQVEETIESTLQVLIINCSIFALLTLIVNHFFTIPYCYYFIALLVSSRALQTIQKLLRGLNNQKLYVASSICYSAIYLSLNVLQICVLKMGVAALFLSQIIANLIVIIGIFIVEKRLRQKIIKPVNLPLTKDLLSVSAPLVPNQFNWWVMSSSDRYVINFFLNSSANGIYSMAYKFPSFLHLVMNLFTTSWQDVSLADEDKDGKYYGNVFEKLYTVSFSMMPALIAATQIYIWFTMESSYHEAAYYVGFLYLGTIFQLFSSYYGVGYIREKKTKNASLTSIYGAIVNIAINILLINIIGLYAAAISTFLGFFIMFIIRERQNREYLEIKIKKGKFAFYFSVALIFSFVSPFFTFETDIFIFVAGAVFFIFVNRKMIKPMLEVLLGKLHR